MNQSWPSEPQGQGLEHLMQLFKALGDPSRMKILFLVGSSEACVSEIASKLNMSESAVSHHLHILRMNGLVRWRREGKTILYTMEDDHVRTIITIYTESPLHFQIRLHKRWSHRLCMAVHPLRPAFWHPTDVCLDRAGWLFGNRPSVISAELYYWRSDRWFRLGLAAAGGCLVYSLDHLPTIFGKKHLLYSRVDLNERHLLMTLISISFSFCNMW